MSLLEDNNKETQKMPVADLDDGADGPEMTPGNKRVRLLAILSAAAIGISCISLVVASGAKDRVTADEAVTEEIQAEVRDQINISGAELKKNRDKIAELQKTLGQTRKNLGLVNQNLQKKITSSEGELRRSIEAGRKDRLRWQSETQRKINNLWLAIDRLELENREANLRIDKLVQRVSALENQN